MRSLVVFALLWLALHLGVSGTALRNTIAGRLGERGFRPAFSVAALALLAALCRTYAAAPAFRLWVTPGWLRWVLVAAMLPAFILFVLSLRHNPTAAGEETLLEEEPHGIQRVTRHPMLNAFAIWAAAHVIGNGDAASAVFFGTFLITAAFGMPLLDHKLAARNPSGWAVLSADTSILPFAAILGRRNRFAPSEIGWIGPLIGTLAWALALGLHRTVFGIGPVTF
jgi:uncharacterized membrane protein